MYPPYSPRRQFGDPRHEWEERHDGEMPMGLRGLTGIAIVGSNSYQMVGQMLDSSLTHELA